MDRDEIEFLISQRLDGTLDGADALRLDEALTADADIRDLFAEHERLHLALQATRSTLIVDGDWLTSQIAAHLDDAPAESYRISRWLWSGPVAVAAMLLIGLTLGVVLLRDDGGPEARPTNQTLAAVPQVTITGPAVAAVPSGGYANISVGVPANLTPAFVSALYLSQDVSSGRVTIRPAGTHASNAFD